MGNTEKYAVATSDNKVCEGRFDTILQAEQEIARRLENEAPFAHFFATGPGYRVITADEADALTTRLVLGSYGFSVENS